jgi:putative restriction endonuclease
VAAIRFTRLAELFINALEMAGATVLVIGALDKRPLELSVVLGDTTIRLEVHLWTVTPGGKGRNRPRERRIQKTATSQFVLRAGVRTIIGGWSEEGGVFAFWDVRRHLQSSENSPSLQISLDTLEKASSVGMATEVRAARDGEEIAIAVHPDYLLWYINEYERLYDCGAEIEKAPHLVEAQPEDEREFIDSGDTDTEQARRHRIVTVVQAFREARFRPQVLRAYSYRCCLTGIALRLVDAAHIVPVSDPTSTDETKNGVALNPLLHRAYDAGLLGLLPGGKTAMNPRILSDLAKQRLDAGADLVCSLIPGKMTLPSLQEFHPPDDYFVRGLLARGWTESEIAQAS